MLGGIKIKENVLLIDIDSHNFPNLVLMKLSAFHKQKGNDVSFIKLTSEDKKRVLSGEIMWFDGEYDRIYAACVFSENKEVALRLKEAGARIGGSGVMNINNDILPPEIEHIYPDYTLYGDDFKGIAYGFLTRGCPRNCPFCIVREKEGSCSHKVADLDEFYKNQKLIKLLDPNILAYKDNIHLLQQLMDSGAYIDFTQGLDIRLTNTENLALIKKIKVKRLHFAWDNPRDTKIKYKFCFVREKLGFRSEKMSVYVLTNFWSTPDEDLERIYWLRDNGFDPYVMVFDKEHAPKKIKHIQRYVNCKWIFKSIDRFEEYMPYSGERLRCLK